MYRTMNQTTCWILHTISFFVANQVQVLYVEVWIMSIDNQVLSTSHENLFGAQRSNLLFETSGPIQNLNKASVFLPLYGNFNKTFRGKGMFRFHCFKPPNNGLFYVSNCFLIGFSLRKTTGKLRDFSNIITCNDRVLMQTCKTSKMEWEYPCSNESERRK